MNVADSERIGVDRIALSDAIFVRDERQWRSDDGTDPISGRLVVIAQLHADALRAEARRSTGVS
ncbi:hypothetical protein EA462_12675 [Natrarchaeobius halalkaliphilus]|uniref:Uncharacterized protein n=1 Tax=Natrarchaeobius halalkaliphilus TaxID=1679091 RepID=A0A3N6LQH5_9EURY|nr:hypothetical protein EA462_12675 [Natrarchaeobius halalkaliphilus]